MAVRGSATPTFRRTGPGGRRTGWDGAPPPPRRSVHARAYVPVSDSLACSLASYRHEQYRQPSPITSWTRSSHVAVHV